MTGTDKQDRTRAEKMIRDWGTDPLQRLALDSADNHFFFGTENSGVIFYTPAGKRLLCLGDPVCQAKDLPRLLSEFQDFCHENHYRCIFNSLSGETAEALRAEGYSVAKYGVEAVLNLAEYTLAGKKRGAMRRNVAKLDKDGCTSQEYAVTDHRDPELEDEMEALSREWHDDKKINLTYSVGDLQFDHPYGRRYFLTRDKAGRLLTVLSFLPYGQGSGWCVDVMYRKPDGPTGAMEHAIISAARKLKEEGAAEVSLNVAPFAGIDVRASENSREERLMHAVFCNMDYGYDFKGLYRFKDKFGPSVWKPDTWFTITGSPS